MHKNKEKKCKSNKLKSRKPYFARIKQNLANFIFAISENLRKNLLSMETSTR